MPKIYLLISVCNYINAIHIKYIANSNVESDVDFNKFQITLDLIEITTGNCYMNYPCWNFVLEETFERLVQRDFSFRTIRYCSLWHRLLND